MAEVPQEVEPKRWLRSRRAFSFVVSILFGLAILIHLTAAYGLKAQDIALNLWEQLQHFNPYLVENDYDLVVFWSKCRINQTYGHAKVDAFGEQIRGNFSDLRTEKEFEEWGREDQKGRQYLLCPRDSTAADVLREVVNDVSNIPFGYWSVFSKFVEREGFVGYLIAVVAILIPLMFHNILVEVIRAAWSSAKRTISNACWAGVTVLMLVGGGPFFFAKWLFLVRFPFYVSAAFAYYFVTLALIIFLPAAILWKVLEAPIEYHHIYHLLREFFRALRAILRKVMGT